MKKQIGFIMTTISLIGVTSFFTACGDSDTFTDPRDGQKYKTVKIGEKVWMAENLKYKEGAEEIKENGAFYTWESALVVCPDGWHLPSKVELEPILNDTNFAYIWSSSEREDFTMQAYEKGLNEIVSEVKDSWHIVRCIQGNSTKQSYLREINGYKAVRIGNQIWMADNLDIKTSNSICYLDDESECSSGRFYPFSEAINVCPEGWRLPSKSEAAKFVNKLIKENMRLKPTRGYYQAKEEKFEDLWGRAMLWTGTYGYVMKSGNYNKPEIWDGSSFIKSENWKVAVRCIADTENKED